MDSDLLNQLTTQLTALQNKLPQKNSQLTSLITFKARQLSRFNSLENPMNELGGLYQILNDPKYNPEFIASKTKKTVEQINIIVLEIIHNQLKNKATKEENKKSNLTKRKPRSKLFIAIAILGTILAALSGAAAIQSIFSAFMSVVTFPAGLIIASQIIFASVAVFAFYVFELNSIGKSLGIRPFDLGIIFKQYSQQSHSFKENFRQLAKQFQYCSNLNDYEKLNKKFETLDTMYKSFQTKIQEAEKAKQPNRLKNIAKNILTAFGAGIFGVLAAMGAQPVLIAFLPYLLGAAIATGPIGLIITAVIMGVCALAGAGLFVFMERKGERLINKLWGTPTKTIDKILSRDRKINEVVEDIKITKASKLSYLKDQQRSEVVKESFEKLQGDFLAKKDNQASLPQLFHRKNTQASSTSYKFIEEAKTFEENNTNNLLTVN